jgi:hypothetical protein
VWSRRGHCILNTTLGHDYVAYLLALHLTSNTAHVIKTFWIVIILNVNALTAVNTTLI